MTRPDLDAIRARCDSTLRAEDIDVRSTANGYRRRACHFARTDIPALLAYIEELTRERDDRRRRCVMLARAHGALADAGCIVPIELDKTIEHAIHALAERALTAEERLERVTRERDAMRRELARIMDDH